MSTLPQPDVNRTTHATVRHVASGDPDGAGLYLTNEVFLYRVVGTAMSEIGEEVIELEDCYSLDVACVPIHDFRARKLRIVTAAPVKD